MENECISSVSKKAENNFHKIIREINFTCFESSNESNAETITTFLTFHDAQ